MPRTPKQTHDEARGERGQAREESRDREAGPSQLLEETGADSNRDREKQK